MHSHSKETKLRDTVTGLTTTLGNTVNNKSGTTIGVADADGALACMVGDEEVTPITPPIIINYRTTPIPISNRAIREEVMGDQESIPTELPQ